MRNEVILEPQAEMLMQQWQQELDKTGEVLILSTRFLNKNDILWRNADNISPIDGYQDIVCHSDQFSFTFKDADGVETSVSVQEFAEILQSSPVYENRPIRLVACEAGADGAITAQYLANYLGVEVLAPTDVVYVYPDGIIKIGDNNSGSWKKFIPKGE